MLSPLRHPYSPACPPERSQESQGCRTYLKNKRQMIGVFVSVPWWSSSRHFNDNTPYTPNITTSTITLTTQYLQKSQKLKSTYQCSNSPYQIHVFRMTLVKRRCQWVYFSNFGYRMKHSCSCLICQEINNSTPRQPFLCSRKGYITLRPLSTSRNTCSTIEEGRKESSAQVLLKQVVRQTK